jgi:hypothetical protein
MGASGVSLLRFHSGELPGRGQGPSLRKSMGTPSADAAVALPRDVTVSCGRLRMDCCAAQRNATLKVNRAIVTKLDAGLLQRAQETPHHAHRGVGDVGASALAQLDGDAIYLGALGKLRKGQAQEFASTAQLRAGNFTHEHAHLFACYVVASI